MNSSKFTEKLTMKLSC